MLQKLTIKNVALIDCAQINLTDGLNVLSGETGAGKSVIIESLNFVLGAKADKSLIRTGQTECMVIAEFDVSDNSSIVQVFNELDIESEDTLIISRKFTIDGKSSIKINGNSATVSMLKKFTSLLVDVHGQSEHFNLLKTSNQLALIDKFGGEELVKLKKTVGQEYLSYKGVLSELDSFGGDESQRLIRLDVLNYQIDEISKANLIDGEEEELIQIKQKLANQERIVNALRLLCDSISSEGGVEDVLGNANKIISSISDFDQNYSELYDRLENAYAEISDISSSANSLLENFDALEYNPYEIDSRLDVIKSLKNKYGGSISAVNEFLENAITEKEKLDNYSEKIQQLEQEKTKIEDKLYDLYSKLSDKRRFFADTLAKNVIKELRELGMPNASFSVGFKSVPDRNDCKFDSSNGFDEIEFMFSANLGEPIKPLSLIISGGEMSRFMLAIKAQTAKYNEVGTFIFDEIDAGISGNVARVVAQKFADISSSTQIVAITHLPQISAMADNNLLIEKTESAVKTSTNVKKLSEEDKVFEIVRLVGGEKDSQTAIKHAEEVISWASAYKNSIK